MRGGLARPSLMCFLNSALILARGLRAVPSARDGGLGREDISVCAPSLLRALTYFTYPPPQP